MTNARLPQDQTQRQTALDVSRSFIVQAPAGSGKTGLLTLRFLALLSIARQPEDILAITFTRKARAEMLERILKALRLASEPQEKPTDDAFIQQLTELGKQALARSDEQGWQLLQQPSRLRILTIDAFNASLTRQLPVLSQYGAQPQVADNAEHLYRQAVRQVLLADDLEPEQEQAVYDLLAHTGFRHAMLEQTLVDMLARREQWLELLQVDVDADRVQLQNLLATIVSEQLSALHQAGSSIWPTLVDLARFAAGHCQQSDKPNASTNTIASLIDLDSIPSTEATALPHWQALSHLLLTADGAGWRKPGGINIKLGFPAKTPEVADMKSLLGDLIEQDNQALLHALQAVRLLPEPSYSDDQWRMLRPVLVTLQLCLAALLLVFREQGEVDHVEMAARALQALSAQSDTSNPDEAPKDAPSELALKLDSRIAHILVDEFQDTSVGQLQLLQQLTRGWQPDDGNTLFLVGDPMQSIYRFRKAEVGIFLSVWRHGLGGIELGRLRLSVNFRTQQGLVDWANQAFTEVLPAVDDMDTGAVHFSSAEAWHPTMDGLPVSTWVASEPNRSGEATEVVHRVQQALLDETKKVAILVRRRSDAAEILIALQAADIAYQAVDMASLEQTPEVRDLLALTQALVHPADRLSWLSLFRAPWCGLELADLLQVAKAGHGQDILDAEVAGLSAAGQQRFSRVRAILQAAVASRQRLSLRQLVSHTWQQLGGPASYESNAALDNALRFFDLLEEQSQAGDLDDPLQLETLLSRYYALPDTRPEAARVQMMTVHKAKGLEFDEVILPGLGYGQRFGHGMDQPLLISETRPVKQGGSLLLGMRKSAADESQDPIYRFIDSLHKTREQNEARRLLYVAATRAKQRLHLLGHVNDKGEAAKNSALSWLWPVLDVEVQASVNTEMGVISSGDDQLLHRLPVDWQPPTLSEDELLKHAQKISIADSEQGLDSLPHSPVAVAIGLVVHRGLEALVKYGVDWWERLDQALWIEQQLSHEGLVGDDLGKAKLHVHMALQNTLDDKTGRWILQSHAESQTEYALSYFEQGSLKTAIIDRTFVEGDGVRWIIDYKTGLHDGGDLEEYIQKQILRHGSQMHKYQGLLEVLGGKVASGALYFPSFKKIKMMSINKV